MIVSMKPGNWLPAGSPEEAHGPIGLPADDDARDLVDAELGGRFRVLVELVQAQADARAQVRYLLQDQAHVFAVDALLAAGNDHARPALAEVVDAYAAR